MTCKAKKSKIKEMQTCVQVVKVKKKQFENLSLKKKMKMAQALKIQ